MDSTCKICSRNYAYSRKAGHYKTICNTCIGTNKRYRKKIKCIDYKGGHCIVCKYNECDRALTFHHTEPANKEFAISEARNWAWSKIEPELNKCVILCHNCHHAIHAVPEYMFKKVNKSLEHIDELRKTGKLPLGMKVFGTTVTELYQMRLYYCPITGIATKIEK